MKLSEIMTSSKAIQGGTPVFKGTRVPVQSLFWHLKNGISIEEFLADFPSVTPQQVVQILEWSGQILADTDVVTHYESFD